jgi:hypothetical protein
MILFCRFYIIIIIKKKTGFLREITKLKYNTLEEDNIPCGLLVNAII